MGCLISTSYLEREMWIFWVVCSEDKFKLACLARVAWWCMEDFQPSKPGLGWPSCHVTAKLISVVFNRHADISAKPSQSSSCNQTPNVELNRTTNVYPLKTMPNWATQLSIECDTEGKKLSFFLVTFFLSVSLHYHRKEQTFNLHQIRWPLWFFLCVHTYVEIRL